MRGTLHFDGACGGNPGPIGSGIVLQTEKERYERSRSYAFDATNNVAEYKALNSGLKLAHEKCVTDLVVQGDSELVIKQAKGEYGINAPHLRPLYEETTSLMEAFDSVTLEHVPREENHRADELAEEALEESREQERTRWKAKKSQLESATGGDQTGLGEF